VVVVVVVVVLLLLLLLMATWMECRSTPLGHPRHAGPHSALSPLCLSQSLSQRLTQNLSLTRICSSSKWVCCWGALLLLVVVLVDNAATRLARRGGGVGRGLWPGCLVSKGVRSVLQSHDPPT